MSNLKFERYFFEIGVYRCSPNFFYSELKKNTQKYLDLIFQNTGVPGEQVADLRNSIEKRFMENYGTWRYSQVIGWIRLYVLGTQIRGEVWFVDAKRIRRDMGKKNFLHYGKAFELNFFRGEDSSVEIYNQICTALQELYRERPFKGRYFDLEQFHNVGPFINWRKLIGLDP